MLPEEPEDEPPLEADEPAELNLGAGEDELLPELEPPEVPEAAGGLYVVPTGALLGATGTLKGLFGAVATLGAVGALGAVCGLA